MVPAITALEPIDQEAPAAPVVVARGCDAIAAAIRELADENGVTVLQYPDLARAIYFTSRAGQIVNEGLYMAVATVLAFVFRVEKVAKTFGSTAMLSEPAVRSLEVLVLSRTGLASSLNVDKSLVGRWASGSICPSEHNRVEITRLVAGEVDADGAVGDADVDVEAAPLELGPQLGLLDVAASAGHVAAGGGGGAGQHLGTGNFRDDFDLLGGLLEVEHAEQLVEAGAHVLAVKDMAGLLRAIGR